MKRISPSRTKNVSAKATFVLAVSTLVTSVGLASPLSALASPSPEPSYAATTLSTTAPAPAPASTDSTAGTPVGTQPAPSIPAATPTAPAPTSTPSSSGQWDRTTFAAAIGAGAEMGQRSARVMGSAAAMPAAGPTTTSTESLTTQGTWSPTSGVLGLDVSSHQPSVDWQHQWDLGARFAYVKATEGNYYPTAMDNTFYKETFDAQYAGARNAGMIRGAYHFAIPNWSSGADQARYFVQNGGSWTADGYTLPPVLDFEFNPYAGRTINGFYFGDTCYGMSPDKLASWVRDFGNTMLALTGRLPVLYTNTSWWNQCLGNVSGFGDYPLWVANYPNSPTNDAGPIPAGWSNYSLWQYSSTGPLAGDSNVWNGSYSELQAFAQDFQKQFQDLAAHWGLGAPQSGVVCGLIQGGCLQDFAYATIYRTTIGGARVVADPIRKAWWGIQGQGGPLGYPVSDQACGLVRGGCTQDFQFGSMYITPTGSVLPVAAPVRDKYWSIGGQNSLGYPLANEICGLGAGGCVQQFANGNIYRSSATAPFGVSGAARAVWAAYGSESGVLGYPTSDFACSQIRSGCVQDFQSGSVYQSTDGTFAVSGKVRTAYWNLGGPASKLGFPTAAEQCGLPAGGCEQKFQSGSIIRTPAGGIFQLTGDLAAAYQAASSASGFLGYPVSQQLSINGGLQQDFEGGSLYYSAASGTHAVPLSLRGNFWLSGGHTGSLGFPTSDLRRGLIRGGQQQDFQRGTLYITPSNGVRRIEGQTRTFYWQNLGQGGDLGYPTGEELCGLLNGACQQNFESGQIVTAGSARYLVAGSVSGKWQELGGLYSYLGTPVSPKSCGLQGNGCKQSFRTGAVFDSPVAGVHATGGAIAALWSASGAESGPLGYPTTELSCSNNACNQTFQRGTIRWTPATGAYFG